MVTRSRLPRKSGGKKTTRLKREFHQITEEDFNNRTMDMKQLTNMQFYSDATKMALEGKEEYGLRTKESDATPENRDVDTEKKISIYTAVNPTLTENELGRWVGIASIDGVRGVVIHSGVSRKDVVDKISFDFVYSRYAPSLMWRNYRFLSGWNW